MTKKPSLDPDFLRNAHNDSEESVETVARILSERGVDIPVWGDFRAMVENCIIEGCRAEWVGMSSEEREEFLSTAPGIIQSIVHKLNGGATPEKDEMDLLMHMAVLRYVARQ